MFTFKEERIFLFVEGLNAKLLVSALQMSSLGKAFKEMVDFMKKVEGVRENSYAKMGEKKAPRWEISVVLIFGAIVYWKTLSILRSLQCPYFLGAH